MWNRGYNFSAAITLGAGSCPGMGIKQQKVKKYEDIPKLRTRFECTAHRRDKRVSLEGCGREP